MPPLNIQLLPSLIYGMEITRFQVPKSRQPHHQVSTRQRRLARARNLPPLLDRLGVVDIHCHLRRENAHKTFGERITAKPPAIYRMCFADIDRYKLHLFVIFSIYLGETDRPAHVRRSGKTAEDQRDRFLLAEI